MHATRLRYNARRRARRRVTLLVLAACVIGLSAAWPSIAAAGSARWNHAIVQDTRGEDATFTAIQVGQQVVLDDGVSQSIRVVNNPTGPDCLVMPYGVLTRCGTTVVVTTIAGGWIVTAVRGTDTFAWDSTKVARPLG